MTLQGPESKAFFAPRSAQPVRADDVGKADAEVAFAGAVRADHPGTPGAVDLPLQRAAVAFTAAEGTCARFAAVPAPAFALVHCHAVGKRGLEAARACRRQRQRPGAFDEAVASTEITS